MTTADLSPAKRHPSEPIIRIPALGLTVRVRIATTLTGGIAIVETTHAPGAGPPVYRRAESEVFEVVTGRYLFEVDGRRFLARRGDLVHVRAGAARAFVNVTGTGARQKVVIDPGIDAGAYFSDLALALEGTPDQAQERLMAIRQRWGVAFVGAPLDPAAAAPYGVLM